MYFDFGDQIFGLFEFHSDIDVSRCMPVMQYGWLDPNLAHLCILL